MLNRPTFSADVARMLTDWNNATPAQRQALSGAARQRANMVEIMLIERRLSTLSTPCESSDRARLAVLRAESAR